MNQLNVSSQNKNNYSLSGYLFAIIATAIWSGNFIVARGLSEDIPPVSLAFWRWLVAIVFFLPFALKPVINEWSVIKANLGYLSLVSLLGITTFNTLIYIAGQSTTAINLSLISLTVPIFIVLLSYFILKESITKNKIIGLVLVFFGVFILFSKGKFSLFLPINFTIGDLWMLLAAFVFGVYSVLLKKKPKELSIWSFQLSTFIIGLMLLLPFYLWEVSVVPVFEVNRRIIFAILYIGVFASLTAFILWNKAIIIIGATKTGMVYYSLPLFSGFLAHLFLNEKIGLVHLFSAVFIVSGIVIANYKPKNST